MIVRDVTGRIQLLCKGLEHVVRFVSERRFHNRSDVGADYIISHRLRASTSRRLRDVIQNDINEFSRSGLRTLLLGRRDLSEDVYALRSLRAVASFPVYASIVQRYVCVAMRVDITIGPNDG